MRRILFPLLIIGLAAGMFTLGSGAFFSDVENSTGNTFAAGSLDLTPDNAAVANCILVNFEPDPTPDGGGFPNGDVSFTGTGGGTACSITVTNAGSLPGDLYVTVVITDGEGSPACTEPESLDDPDGATCGTAGELDDQLVLSQCDETSAGLLGSGTVCAGLAENGTVSFRTVEFLCGKVADVLASGTYNLTIDLDSDPVTNRSQTDTVATTIKFDLVQDGAPTPCV